MSSSPPTEMTLTRSARWRSPSGWSLRTRVIALLVALLVILGLAVGGTTELALHKTLYGQIDTQLLDSAGPPPDSDSYHPPGGGAGFRRGQGKGTLRAFIGGGSVVNARVQADFGEDGVRRPASIYPFLLTVTPGAGPAT